MSAGTLTHEQHVEHLMSWYQGASEECRKAGREWYDVQREAIRTISQAYAVKYSTCAAVVAALSPRTQWAQNLAGAARLIRAWKNDQEMPTNVTLYRKNAVKAWRILNGEHAYDVFATSPKVFAFWSNLMGDETAITVDTWMVKSVGEERGAKSGIKAPLYNRISAAVRDAAFQVGEVPSDFQAIVWCAVRGKAE